MIFYIQGHAICKESFISCFLLWMPCISFSRLIAVARTDLFLTSAFHYFILSIQCLKEACVPDRVNGTKNKFSKVETLNPQLYTLTMLNILFYLIIIII